LRAHEDRRGSWNSTPRFASGAPSSFLVGELVVIDG
jgi:hypothetical protein